MAPSHNQSMPPPIRTNTASSQTTQSSKSSTSQLSPPHSPASATSTSRSVSSPTEASFFGAITARIRGRSRSRSRGGTLRKRSKSPMPQQTSSSSQFQHGSSSAGQVRQAVVASPVQSTRPSLHDGGRRSTSGSDPWRGRHSNDWLFGGYSVTASAKELMQRRK
ncbi:hypothetical protein P3342_004107 [Pyrenophora teres f. teres]|uniref:Uncharacterized protein n=1 Tax=Pyrenophora teres f. teres (strain 0-1) TaxID=861557 RepID=E3S7I5_PYRTT|nr:hypothetical protein PTT_18790 [Pyrenophora teres f. teres 0-1]KAK1916289.1 hypothetical protein P3342_004107 [Pyrenophora teres f. teres]